MATTFAFGILPHLLLFTGRSVSLSSTAVCDPPTSQVPGTSLCPLREKTDKIEKSHLTRFDGYCCSSPQGGALPSPKWCEVAPWSEALVRRVVLSLGGQREDGRGKKEAGEDNQERREGEDNQETREGGEGEREELQRDFGSSTDCRQYASSAFVAEETHRREQTSTTQIYRKCLSVGGKFLVYVQLTRLVLYVTVSLFVWLGVISSVTGREVVGGAAAKGCFQFWYATLHVVGAVTVDVFLGPN
eukprot:GHVS01010504.1.p1 GENE.GHVS01010504.1~~GHVS01010504.1.p1  ORF type:complete len:245 (+),score=56.55 GHVS01010504.1:96-830(+)